jgi:hypothetical protein
MLKNARNSVSVWDLHPGVISGRFKAECEFMLYSFDVKFEGRNVCRLGDPLFHNAKNIMG